MRDPMKHIRLCSVNPFPVAQCNINVIKRMSFSISIIILRLICSLCKHCCVLVYDIYMILYPHT